MRERFAHSNIFLEKAISLSPKPVEALALLANNRRMLGERDVADDLLRQAEKLMPHYGPLHEVRINFSLPEWGGSAEEVAFEVAAAKKAGIDEDWQRYFDDTFISRPTKLSNPGAEKTYWERAIAERPTFSRLKSQLQYFERVQNWSDAVPAATRVIEQFPNDVDSYWIRASANEKLGHLPESLNDYRIAAALGHERATQTLIQAHIRGGLGILPRDWHALDQVCRYGAALGSAAAANCMASMFWEGSKVGPPFHTDIAQAHAWHLVAARAGYHNSQYDLGWLMLTGRVPGVGQDQAERNGLFWLRRAAELEHQFAKKKLQEGGYTEAEVVNESGGTSDLLLEVVWQALRHLIRAQ